MNDALLAEINAAYQTQNLRPIRRLFHLHEDGVDYACPLVALALHRGQVNRADPDVMLDGGANAGLEAASRTFGEDWTLGFLDGFDGQDSTKAVPDYLAGYEVGLTACQQLSPRDYPT